MSRIAPFWARACGVLIQGVGVAGLVVVLISVGVLPSRVLAVEAGWFWADWLILLWLDSPGDLAIPVVAFCTLSTLLNLVFERFDAGPSAWFLKLRVVDSHGRPASWPQLFGRALGVILSFMTAGFGFLWILVSRHQRSVSDVISGTCVTRD